MAPDRPLLGAVLAGGASRRFGSPKALATVGGRSIVERVVATLRPVCAPVVVVGDAPALPPGLAVPVVADERAGAGPLAGIVAALRAAEQRGLRAAACLACDLPFASPALVARLAALWREGGAWAVLPESGGRRGLEPLFAVYDVRCLPALVAALDRGERAVHGVLQALPLARLPLQEVARFGTPEVLFLNVNTPEELARAERLAGERPAP